MKTEEVVHVKAGHFLGLSYFMLRPMSRKSPKQGTCSYTSASVHLSKMTAKRRGIAKVLFLEIAERNNVEMSGAERRPLKGEGELNRKAWRVIKKRTFLSSCTLRN